MSSQSPTILRVAVPGPFWHCLDYLPPVDGQATLVSPGQRVSVPLGRRQVTGILIEPAKKSAVDIKKLRHVIAIVDKTPLLPDLLLQLFYWVSDYYHYPLGEVILNALPKSIRQGKSSVVGKKMMHEALNKLKDKDKQWLLNPHQQQAVSTILNCHGFATFLLAGVTGSGKTEVYLKCIAELIKEGKQALILVPEITLTPQTVNRFKARFDVPIIVFHSGLTDKERMHAWVLAQNGTARIIIGTRSAIFSPLKNLGIIILDEEHDTSFKQQSGLRYSARDVAVMRGRLENIPVVLGSATPSLESLRNVETKRYLYIELPQRVGGANMPIIKFIDMRGQPLIAGISQALFAAIARHLEAQGQVLLFLNRRGYAPVLMCHHCGWMVLCDYCDARLTWHQDPPRLICHHCGVNKKPPCVCEQCKQSELIKLGSGTERLQQTLQEKFSDYPIIRIDRDTIRGKNKMNTVLEQVHKQKAQILVGTQMLAKGHHFPQLTLVAIVDADGGLFCSDFRALERMAQLIIQVAGRAGRENRSGEVLIQTHHPDHSLLNVLIHQGYFTFARAVLQERQTIGLPPYMHFALIRAEAKEKNISINFLQKIKKLALKQVDTTICVMGPVPAPMERKAGYHRAQLLFQSPKRPALQDFLKSFMQQISAYKPGNRVRWSLDVDPQEML